MPARKRVTLARKSGTEFIWKRSARHSHERPAGWFTRCDSNAAVAVKATLYWITLYLQGTGRVSSVVPRSSVSKPQGPIQEWCGFFRSGFTDAPQWMQSTARRVSKTNRQAHASSASAANTSGFRSRLATRLNLRPTSFAPPVFGG